jgi:hypothetical protein
MNAFNQLMSMYGKQDTFIVAGNSKGGGSKNVATQYQVKVRVNRNREGETYLRMQHNIVLNLLCVMSPKMAKASSCLVVCEPS